MNKKYRFLNPDSKFSEEVLSITKRVNDLVLKLDPEAIKGDYWQLAEFEEANIVTFIDYETHKDNHRPLKTNWKEVVSLLPEFKSLVDHLQVEKYFGHTQRGNWGVHKHVFSPATNWNLSAVHDVPDNSYVRLHETEKSFGPAKNDYCYDHLPNDYKSTVVDEFKIKTGDIVSLNVWEWHSFEVPNHSLVSVNLFYFKDSYDNNIDNILKLCQKI